MEIRVTAAVQPKAKPEDESNLGFGQIFTDHMLLVDFENATGWHNARIEPYTSLVLDPAATCLHYGQLVFEGLKAYHGKDGGIYLFRAADNFARLNQSARRVCMPELDVDFALTALKKLILLDREWIPKSPGTSLYIRPTMIATEPFLGVRPATRYLFYVILGPVGSYYPEGLNPVRSTWNAPMPGPSPAVPERQRPQATMLQACSLQRKPRKKGLPRFSGLTDARKCGWRK